MMKASTLFWGVVFILVGGLLLLGNLGLITVNVWAILGPSLVILLGVWILGGVLFGRTHLEHANLPLQGAEKARLRLKHGAGRLRVFAGVSEADLVEGDFGGGLDLDVHREGDQLNAILSVPARAWNFPLFWNQGSLDWSVGVNPHVPIILELETGANEARIDLKDLQVHQLSLKTGASSTEVTLPASAGEVQARLYGGAASLRVKVPSGVAARIQFIGGLASMSVDSNRFPKVGNVYLSPDYDTAANKVDLYIENSVGSLDVR
jgi:hypothetical protein